MNDKLEDGKYLFRIKDTNSEITITNNHKHLPNKDYLVVVKNGIASEETENGIIEGIQYWSKGTFDWYIIEKIG